MIVLTIIFFPCMFVRDILIYFRSTIISLLLRFFNNYYVILCYHGTEWIRYYYYILLLFIECFTTVTPKIAQYPVTLQFTLIKIIFCFHFDSILG